jgi:LmbE family N-acetylglucosaminyl deacetylase
MPAPLRLLIIGAHPDDADYSAGGLATLYRRHGHVVKMVSVTDGGAGHHVNPGPEMVVRRRAEAAASGAVIGAEYITLDAPDGGLLPTLENRAVIIRLIRGFNPDLVLTHRPNDYHPDHRYTSQLVQDSSYMLTVPAVAPETPHLAKMPVIAYMPDDFQKPYPLTPTVAIDVGPALDDIVTMLDCHVSQFYEWLPYNQGTLDQLPPDAAGRRACLRLLIEGRLRHQAARFRDLLIEIYGKKKGKKVEFAEAFEPCEYGSPLDDAARERLFPFVGVN